MHASGSSVRATLLGARVTPSEFALRMANFGLVIAACALLTVAPALRLPAFAIGVATLALRIPYSHFQMRGSLPGFGDNR